MAEPRTAIRLAVYYLAIATASFLVGGGLALLGFWLGFGQSIGVFLSTFLEPNVLGRSMAVANPLVALVVGGGGIVIWQVGKAAGLYWTLTMALEPEARSRANRAGAGQASGRQTAERE